jgi:hypothetical protein
MGTVDAGSQSRTLQPSRVEKGVTMPQLGSVRRTSVGDHVELVAAGVRAKGEFHCSECGYGVTVYKVLPVCPMCGSEEWEKSDWSPLGRARSILQ